MKEITNGILLLQMFWIFACSTTKQVENLKNEDIKEFVGREVTLIGETHNAKLGAVLVLENGQTIWMDKMESWPDGYYLGDDNAKTVKVVGVLIERHDLPVFIPNEDNSNIQQGIPVQKGTDLNEASHRFLLKDAKWEVIKN